MVIKPDYSDNNLVRRCHLDHNDADVKRRDTQYERSVISYQFHLQYLLLLINMHISSIKYGYEAYYGELLNEEFELPGLDGSCLDRIAIQSLCGKNTQILYLSC